ncbi:MAG: hypothetical protein A2913_00345 [Parcubacteria group bacterium RIFCSPLOWO2_01_FULL_40_65]|nr:MAG: hypothetical protein A2913_00345 [Parcubacteria group bacterium RIFCSPLOWO2_01_FULL_40_65]
MGGRKSLFSKSKKILKSNYKKYSKDVFPYTKTNNDSFSALKGDVFPISGSKIARKVNCAFLSQNLYIKISP